MVTVRYFLVMLLLAASTGTCDFKLGTAVAADTPETWGTPDGGEAATDKVESDSPALVRNPTPTKLRDGLTRREKRGVGFSIRNSIRIAREIKAADPDGIKEMSRSELAHRMGVQMLSEAPPSFAPEPGREWDEFLAFLVKLFEAIMPFILMFI